MIDNFSIHHVERAQKILQGHILQTPLAKSEKLDKALDADIWFKCENMQHTGSFKYRGAYYALSQLDESERLSGVIACSSGNHAQGVALAARKFGIKATILMPEDAPEIKINRTKSYGAEIILYDRSKVDREILIQKIAKEKQATLIHPFENFNIIAGQGTVGLEIVEQLKAFGKKPDIVAICCGGGGLTAGVSTAISSIYPEVDLYAVEPEGFDDTARSLISGQRERNAKLSGSICDAIITPQPGELTFQINEKLLKSAVCVSDEEALNAVNFAATELKQIVESGGAVCLAALMFKKIDITGKTVVVTLSGGNIDKAMLAKALETNISIF